MALWQIDIQKSFGEEYFTNVYHGDVLDQGAARDLAAVLIGMERELHSEGVVFVNYRVRPYPGPAEGTTYALTGTGHRDPGSWIPLFNVVRVDFPAPTGRPSRKFYRLPLNEADVENNALSVAAVTEFQTTINAVMAEPGMDPLCDVDGQPLSTAIVFRQVAMRQLRRGSRRRATPII